MSVSLGGIVNGMSFRCGMISFAGLEAERPVRFGINRRAPCRDPSGDGKSL
jgi:hypothetical protein